MATVTLRGLDAATVGMLKLRANREGLSMNRYLSGIIREHVLGKAIGKPHQYDDLDELFGSMSAEDAQAIEDSVSEQRAIDPEVWS